MGLDDKTLQEIIRRILGVARPVRIILFGSAAAGAMTRDSDVDLLVVEDAPGDVRQESVRLREALRGLGYPFDVVVISRDRFNETVSLVGSIAHPASKYGKLLYEAA